MSNVPKLRFDDCAGEWSPSSLGDYFEFRNGINATKEQYGKGYKFINVLDIINNSSITHDKIIGSVDVSETVFKRNIVEYGDVLFQRSSETRDEAGQSNVYLDKNTPATFGGFVIRGKGKRDYDPVFFNYLLKSSKARKEITTKSNGSTRFNVGQETLSEVELDIPAISEQQKIAAFLTAVDTKIEQLTQKEALLKQYKKGVMQKVFSQEIRFKADDGSEFPEWTVKSLSKISKRKTAKNTDESIKQVLTNSATKGIVSQTDYFDKDIANQDNLGGYYIVDTDDYVYNPRISVSAPVGPIKRNHLSIGVMSPLYTVFELACGEKGFFERYFETTLWHRYMNRIANFGARHDRMNVTTSDFYEMPMPYPSLAEQQKITDFLSGLDMKLQQATDQLDAAKTFKKGLLQQMFV